MRIEMDDGVGLAVEVTGHGAPLLLVHGFGGAKEDFADHVERFAEHATVVVFDHRGHGESDHPTGTAAYSLDRLTADTLGVADHLGFATFRLLGHSMRMRPPALGTLTASARNVRGWRCPTRSRRAAVSGEPCCGSR